MLEGVMKNVINIFTPLWMHFVGKLLSIFHTLSFFCCQHKKLNNKENLFILFLFIYFSQEAIHNNKLLTKRKF